ncbi:MAG TPA: nuclear transport factor 2 family protein [Pyrinomonadaceae bacterium]|jgi:ketosteroid isomerase-like protein|nr:nuclear transport factor 2 family protein [Pyrinomonadaceae bacterium]
MFRQINQLGPLGIIILACTSFAISFAIAYGWAQQNHASVQPDATIAALGSDRDQDGLSGPVNRVRTETARLSIDSGKLVEGPRELLESTTYDPKGKKIDTSYFLVSNSSQQVGKEEYTHDDKGNVIAMTLRDQNDKILSKEVYRYETDAVGNWVKMVASTLIYEDGKTGQLPFEVTYRNISYYFDQAIAEIAGQNSSANQSASGEPLEEGDSASLRRALEGWVAATNARDLEGLMKFYNQKIDAFYRARNVSQEFVRADRARMFKRADSIEVVAIEPEINLDQGEADMSFRKRYVARIDGRERRGEVIQLLRWKRTGGGWKIISERDVKVLRED